MAEIPNLDYIREIAGGNSDFEKKFLSIIQMEFPQEKEEYAHLLKSGQLQESAKLVHKLKHKFGILGLNEGYNLAIAYEDDLKVGNTALKEDFEEVLKIVNEFILKTA